MSQRPTFKCEEPTVVGRGHDWHHCTGPSRTARRVAADTSARAGVGAASPTLGRRAAGALRRYVDRVDVGLRGCGHELDLGSHATSPAPRNTHVVACLGAGHDFSAHHPLRRPGPPRQARLARRQRRPGRTRRSPQPRARQSTRFPNRRTQIRSTRLSPGPKPCRSISLDGSWWLRVRVVARTSASVGDVEASDEYGGAHHRFRRSRL